MSLLFYNVEESNPWAVEKDSQCLIQRKQPPDLHFILKGALQIEMVVCDARENLLNETAQCRGIDACLSSCQTQLEHVNATAAYGGWLLQEGIGETHTGQQGGQRGGTVHRIRLFVRGTRGDRSRTAAMVRVAPLSSSIGWRAKGGSACLT